jgi:transposase
MTLLPCPGCNQRAQRIAELEKRLGELQAENEHLHKENDRLQAANQQLQTQTQQATQASKRQAAPFSKGAPKKNPKTNGRKAGARHGKHGHRLPPEPTQIDEILDAPLPDCCPDCGGDIAEDKDVAEQFQTEIPVQPIRRKIIIHKGCCKNCGKPVRGRHRLQTSDATGAAASQIGPDAQAAIAYLNKHGGLSHGKIAHYFQTLFGIPLSRGASAQIVLRVADRLQPAYQEIKESLKESKVIVPDETGWRIGGHPVWLHAWVGDQATCYAIDRRRSGLVLQEVIGIDYAGTLVHDGAATYETRFPEAIHQQCVGHPLRRAHDLEEAQTGAAKTFPRQVIHLLQGALQVRNDYVAGQGDTDALHAAHESYVADLLDLTRRPRSNEANETFAKHLYNHNAQWFMFLVDPSIPATNHQAEQALRNPITTRKVSGGNRGHPGGTAQAVICSVQQTCTQQNKSALKYISSAICGFISKIIG